MNSKICISIYNIYEDKLRNWKDSIAYTYDNKIAYKVNFKSINDNEFIQFLSLNNINYEILIIEYKFSKNDINKAELLELSISVTAGDAENINTERKFCNCCKKEIPIINKNILVDYKLIKGKDITATNPFNYAVIISEKVKEIINSHNDKCAEFIPIYNIKNNQIIDGYYKLVLKEGVGNAVAPTITIKDGFCNCCNLYDINTLKSVLYFDRNTWTGADIFTTPDWFGDRYNYKCGKVYIITKKLYDVLKENNIKGFYVNPAFFV